MPTYEYTCTKCAHEEDHFMSISKMEKARLKCQDCGHKLRQAHRTPPNGLIPGSCSFDGDVHILGGTGQKQPPITPINIIDKLPGGGCKITRIGAKSDD